jgi:uncharacterized protein (DUF3084 family)
VSVLEEAVSQRDEAMRQRDEALRQKDTELQVLEERHNKYVLKAKSVIKTLDATQNPGPAEVATLRNQLLEKHKIIQDLEVKYCIVLYCIVLYCIVC